ncbi:hypothetical protein [Vibrio fluvialis]|nr:hypothetical protein [Vibrio fluvialis]MCG6389483.1 hypothetical protein [Vibrio fluvialis]
MDVASVCQGRDGTNSFSSGVFPALLQNANFIAAVLLFLAVLLGIKALTD